MKEIKDELIEELEKFEIDNVAFIAFSQKLAALNNDMKDLMLPTEDGWKDIDAEKRESLLNEFDEAATALEDCMEFLKDSADPQLVATREILTKLSPIMSSEMNTIRKYNPEKGAKTLPDLLEESRVDTVDLSNKTTRTMGGNQSSRIPIKLMGADGKVISGFFTKESYYEPEKELKDYFSEIAKRTKDAEVAEMFRGYVDKFIEKNSAMFNNQKETMYMVIMDNLLAQGGQQMSVDNLYTELATLYDKNEADIASKIGKEAKKYFLDKGISINTHLNVNHLMLDLKPGDRIDSRNSAMSQMASLLGFDNLICESKDMNIRTKDGTVIKGTFMAESDYTDVNRPGPEGLKVGKNSIDDSDRMVLKQLADLQVLDYICGNVDRHQANMLYKFDENGRLIGVQGIDNDSSFGRASQVRGTIAEMVGPGSMGCMSKATANKILSLTPEQLEFTLRGRVAEESIESSKKRLKELKDTILRSRRQLDPDSKELVAGSIREFEDEDWKTLTFDKIKYSANIFSRATQGIETIANNALVSTKERKAIDTEVNSVNRGSYAGIKNQLEQITEYEKALKKRRKAGRSSDNYDDIQRDVAAFKKLLEKIEKRMRESVALVKGGDTSPEAVYGQFVSKSDLLLISEASKKLKGTADKYSTGKRDYFASHRNKRPSDYTKKRMDIAVEVSKFADYSSVITAEEEKKTQDNVRRATDQMVKLSKKEKNNENNVENIIEINNEQNIIKENANKKTGMHK